MTKSKIFRFAKNNRPGYMKSFTFENQYLRLADVVEPLWRKPYEIQLQIKRHWIEKCMTKALNILLMNRKITDPHLKQCSTENAGKICHVTETIPSPVTQGYRNKTSCNVGTDITGNSRTLGMTVGNLKDQTALCVQPYFLTILRDRHKQICKVAQEFIYKSAYGPSSQSEHTGFWLTVTVRSTTSGQVMVILWFLNRNNTQGYIDGAKEELYQYFVNGPGKQLQVDSLYFQSSNRPNDHNANTFHLLHGVPTITEHLLDLQFQISPTSFFQGNTPCAEILYTKALELGQVDSQSTVLDVCCGTGTIGLIAARKAKKVLGVDIVPQAIQDAKINAQTNGITSAKFTCEKAHRFLREVVKDDNLPEDMVAILNPGSPGVNKKLIQSVRNCEKIRKVVYISCKPVGNVLINFADLMTPADGECFHGSQFRAKVAIPVDMFPQTVHCEVLLLFER